MPLLPIEERWSFNDPNTQTRIFLLRVFYLIMIFVIRVGEKLQKWKDLYRLHSRYKIYGYGRHCSTVYRQLGRLLSGNDPRLFDELKRCPIFEY